MSASEQETARPANIILLGFMGTGKSAVGRCLAGRLGFGFSDTDSLIEQRAGLSISDIFARFGEEGFRMAETETLRRLEGVEEMVIATGGGVVTREENFPLIDRIGLPVCLDARPETILERLRRETAHRPLLADASDPLARIREILTAREHLYRRVPYHVVTDQKSVERIAEEVEKLYRSLSNDRDEVSS